MTPTPPAAPATPVVPPAASNVATTPTTTTPAPSTTTVTTGPITQQGPGDAHGSAHANSNSGPAASKQGQPGSGSSCDGLCHNGQDPALSPATADTAPAVPATATPIPVTSTPVTSTPVTSIPVTAPVTPSSPSTPSKPSKTVTPPTFSSTSSAKPVSVTSPGGGTSVLAPLLTIGTVPGTRPAGTLVALAPATAAVGLTPAAATVPGAHAGAVTHARAHHSAGSHPGSGSTTIQFIPRLIEHIPAWVWIALGASLALAALGTGAALLTRRRQRAQAGELATVAAAALTDPLTGVLNRRGFIEAVERELARARRYHHPFVLAYVDVRGLKSVNDTEGHLAGDNVIKNVAALLTESARADDVVGRLGGDELCLLLVEQTPDAAKTVTRRIEAQVAARRATLGLGAHWDLTVGSAAFPQDGQSVDELLGTADRRLYQQRGIQLTEAR